jgi:hypothetical protein
MALKVEWKNRTAFSGTIVFAGFALADVHRDAAGLVHYQIHDSDVHSGGPYEDPEDAFQDCESEVRRLLKEAGCEVAP